MNATASAETLDMITEQGTIAGTLRYIAPEGLQGHDADARNKFSLG